jgi:ABC-type branched-subunit amino acid transport system substrate-binding protein
MISAPSRQLLLNGNKTKFMNKIRVSFLIVFILTLSSNVFAQNEYEDKYNRGKQLYESGKYDLSMEVLKPLTSSVEKNKYAEYAHYFYSLSALKAGRFMDANQMLTQLTKRYPEWDKINEVYYLWANVAFEEGNYRSAIKHTNKVSGSKNLKEDVASLKTNYFRKINPIDTLIALQQQYPDDVLLAKSLAERLSASRQNEKDKMLLQYLVQEYKLDAAKFVRPKKASVKKDVYHVAVLFPFMVESLDPEKMNRPNQFVLDMYEGIRLAVDSLKKENINIKLFAYETEKDTAKFSKLLKLPELKSMDLIIGPVFSMHNEMLADFAKANQINVLNPLATTSGLIRNNDFVYLYQPTNETQAHKLASFVSKADTLKKNVIIMFGETYKDSVLAYNYRDTLLKKDFKVVNFLKVSKLNTKEIKHILEDSIKLTKINHIFVPVADQVVAATVISAMDIMKQDVPVFTYSEWLSYQLLTFDQLERRKVHFLMPEFVNYDDPNVKRFRKAYVSRNDVFPTTFSYQGFDMMLNFGRSLGKYGNMFNDEVRRCGLMKGSILAGMDFSCANSNQVVPITKFENFQLKPVYGESIVEGTFDIIKDDGKKRIGR